MHWYATDALAQWLSGSRMSLFIRQFDWLVPLLQTVHILAIAMVIASALMIDLRLLGFSTSQSLQATARHFMPWIWGGIGLLAVSGTTLIVAEPQRSLPNPAFLLKMILLALAIASTRFLQVSLAGDAGLGPSSGRPAPAASALMRAVAVTTFVLWCAIAFAGRFIAYLQDI